jgi:multisubunit Na+/H+ antiporter MnhB subunit
VDTSDTQPGQAVAPYTPPAPVAAPAPVAQPYVRPDRTAFVLAIVSMGCAIPLTGIGAGILGLPGLVIVWVGIVLVNLIYGAAHRRP